MMKKSLFGCLLIIIASAMSISCKINTDEPKELEVLLPEVSNFNVSGSDGVAVLTWDNPKDERVLWLKISVTPTSENLKNPKILETDVQTCTIDGLEDGKEYTFTIKTMDNSGHFSKGVKQSVTIVSSVMGIKLTPSTTERTRENIIVSIDINPKSNVQVLKWANSYYKDDIKNSGDDICLDNANLTFTTYYNDTYFVYAKDSKGREEIKSIEINNIDNYSPSEISDLRIDAVDGVANLTWQNPQDEDFTGVQISLDPAEGDLSTPKTISKDFTSYTVNGLTPGQDYSFTIKTIDDLENISTGVTENGYNRDTLLRLNLEPQTKEITNSSINIKAIINYDSNVKTIKWASGEHTEEYFKNNGTVIEGSGITFHKAYYFTATENGKYTVFAEDKKGRTDLKIINITNIDKIPPSPIKDLKFEAIDGTVNLSWINPTEEDIKNIYLTMSPNEGDFPTQTGRTVIEKNCNSFKVKNLTNGKKYTFKFGVYDEAGNISSVTQEVIPKNTVMGVNLNLSTSERTKDNISVTVDVNKDSAVKTIKWAKGNQTEEYFKNNGNIISVSSKLYSFNVSENGTYTVFAEDEKARTELKTIVINNIDKQAPGSVTNVKSTYDEKENSISLSWQNPTDEDFREIKLCYEDQVITLSNLETFYKIKNAERTTSYIINLTTYDDLGNEGIKTDISLATLFHPEFEKFEIEKITLDTEIEHGLGYVTAYISGKHFKSYGTDNRNFSVTCDTWDNIKFEIESIPSDTFMKIKIYIPYKSGDYSLKISYKFSDSTCTGIFHVYGLGDIFLSDGTRVAYDRITEEQKSKAIAIFMGGYDNGHPLGVGLEHSNTELAWDNSKYYTYPIRSFVCTPKFEQNYYHFYGDMEGCDNNHSGPAFVYSRQEYGKNLPEGYQDGWYLPSIAELHPIFSHKDKINKALKALGRNELQTGGYWSSSQTDTKRNGVIDSQKDAYAWGIYYEQYQGTYKITDYGKTTPCYVYAIRAF